MASLYIKDEKTNALVDRLARLRGTSKTEAVRRAVEAELTRNRQTASPRERLEDFYQRYPVPESSGLAADKTFFDDLSGDL
ncbi:type II toxin-antitoxin system VapB family antitoxin [Sphingomonas sp. Leaf4]|uniref:type II toxin-antitoxin system VapB family antitoxin n=1 Tax=Sphingomonas sp. Leaf4 TaxID=2876553 RepID=UPI001E494E0E|nr:type II toxin-antitoxin system VapB family antitoxin [Sphingomonas sp. Leaf4]